MMTIIRRHQSNVPLSSFSLAMSDSSMLIQYIVIFILSCIAISLIGIFIFRRKFHSLRLASSLESSISIGFFHPHCRGGGGGERVLWKAIEGISQLNQDGCDDLTKADGKKSLNRKKTIHVVVYTSDPKTEGYHKDVLDHIKARFDIYIPKSLSITFIHIPPMILSSNNRFTLVMESIHSMKLAYNALCQFTPHVYIDTTGCAFTFIVAKILANCKVLAYVHYPTISTDMLQLVWERRPTYNNTSSISKNKVYTWIKLIYYILFSVAYGMVGSLSDIILVNSTWTYNHISYLWRFRGLYTWISRMIRQTDDDKINVVYPPCDISSVNTSIKNEEGQTNNSRRNNIVSIGQFRPEKDHAKQIKSFAKLLSSNETISNIPNDVKLVLIGSCRNEADYNRVVQLRDLAFKTLRLPQTRVEFVINEPYRVLQHLMATSLIGLHTMWNEHFGISVVEMMSNGLITIGHNSGGPKSDIITLPSLSNNKSIQRTGFLANTEEEYKQAFMDIFNLNGDERDKIRNAAKTSCERFSDEIFIHEFKYYLSKIIQ